MRKENYKKYSKKRKNNKNFFKNSSKNENNCIIVRFMTHKVCYNKTTEGSMRASSIQSLNVIWEDKKMTRNIENRVSDDMRIVAENCNFSAYTMATVACGILLCVGIIVYALFAA